MEVWYSCSSEKSQIPCDKHTFSPSVKKSSCHYGQYLNSLLSGLMSGSSILSFRSLLLAKVVPQFYTFTFQSPDPQSKMPVPIPCNLRKYPLSYHPW